MKIFGVGTQRTGTTSLCDALSQFGIDAIDWEDHYRITNPMVKSKNINHSIFDEHDAFTDLPIPLLYKELDKKYPGSKFILTLRDEKGWLNSAKCHQERLFKRSGSRELWETDKLFYGVDYYDPVIFLERYREHNEDVIKYFKERPNDLLVLNICETTGRECWRKLGEFIGKSVPEIEFPHKNKGPSIIKMKSQKMIIPIMSCASNRETKQKTIRETWAKNLSIEWFFVESGNETRYFPEKNKLILNCSNDYMKTQLLCKYVTQNLNFNFMLKCDDSTLVIVNKLLNEELLCTDYQGYGDSVSMGSYIVSYTAAKYIADYNWDSETRKESEDTIISTILSKHKRDLHSHNHFMGIVPETSGKKKFICYSPVSETKMRESYSEE